MIAHGTCYQEDDDLPLWQGSALKKKVPLSTVRVQITRETIRSRDTQCNTGE